MNKVLFSLVFCIVVFGLNAQHIPSVLQQQLEYWMEKHASENIDLTQIQEQWEYFLEHPLNLNTASKEELIQLNLLNELQINELLLHREKLGKFLSIYELQTLSTWDSSFLQLILPFVEILDRSEKPALTLKELKRNGKIEGVNRVQYAFAGVDTNLIGNQNYYLTKIRFTYLQRVSIGLTAEKDAGEPFFTNNNKYGFDFYSFHLNYKGGKFLKNVLIGDYHIQIGQGLNCWTSYSLGKSLDISTSKKNARVIRPHTSTDENRFFRGTAFDFTYRKFSFFLFASYNQKDASIQDSLNQVVSIPITGYHRSNTEFAKKDKLTEKVLGSYLRYEKGNFHIGLASVFNQLSLFYNKKMNVYNTYDFRGDHLLSSSIDYSYSFKNMLFFGEYSFVDFSKQTAFLSGVMIALDSKTSLSMLYRNYEKGYETFYNAGFSEGNSVQNEKGIYLGVTVKPTGVWNLQAYVDIFEFPWLRYQVNLPSKGIETVFQVTYKPSKSLECYLRFYRNNKEKNDLSNYLDTYNLINENQKNIRFNLNYQFNNNWVLRSRIEGVELLSKNLGRETGMLFYQDIGYEISSKKLELISRFVMYDTDSYASRIYCYESNPSYQYSAPAFFGKGIKAYALIRYSIFKKIDCWLKVGNTSNQFQQFVSSEGVGITGKNKREINIQIRWRI